MLPERTPDTMSEAIALSSPNGRISKSARAAANKRLSEALFGPGGLPYPSCPQPSDKEYYERKAKEFRELAAMGVQPKRMIREAEKMEAKAKEAR